MWLGHAGVFFFPIGHATRSSPVTRNCEKIANDQKLSQQVRRAIRRFSMGHRIRSKWLFGLFLTLLFVLALFLHRESERTAYIRLPLFEGSEILVVLSQSSSQVIEHVKSVPYLQHHFLQRVNSRRLLDALELQHYLQCTVERGVFKRGHDQDMRLASHSYEWFPDHNCSSTQSPNEPDSIISHICEQLQGKRLLLVGDRVQYSLHNLILHRLGVDRGNASRLCAGAEFCNWHQICPQLAHPLKCSPLNPSTPLDNEPLTCAPAFLEKHFIPANQSYIGIMRYAQSTSLLLTSKRSDRRLNDPYLPSSTGVRENESYWRFWLAGSDITVLSKGPMPAPAWSWKGATDSSLSFSDMPGFALRPVWDRVFSKAFENFTMPYGRSLADSVLPFNVHEYTAADIIKAAIRATIEVWLPATMRTLYTLRNDLDGPARNKVIVWRGEWFAQSRCNQIDMTARQRSLEDVLGLGKRAKSQYVEDPWLAFHNVQGAQLVHPLR